MSVYYIRDVNLKFKSKIIAAAKCISIDYNLKQSGANLTSTIGFGLKQSVVLAGLNPFLVISEIIARPRYIAAPKSKIKIDWACIGLNWKADETYRFVFEEDFVREKIERNQGNLAFEETYTINPVPALLGRDPIAGPDVANNTKIEFVFDRLMRPGRSGKIYLYEETGATDTLVKEYDIIMDVEQSNNANNLSTFTLETRGLLKSSTTYYVTTDAKVFRDFDELYFPKLDAGDYVFTTDSSEAGFPDLISFQMSGGTLSLAFIRYRNFDAAFAAETDFTSDTFFSKIAGFTSDPVGEFAWDADVNFTAAGQGNFESLTTFDSAINYTAGGKGSFESEFDQPDVDYIRYRNYNSALDAETNLLPDTFFSVTRNLSGNIPTVFNQSANADFGMLDTIRSSESYIFNTFTNIISNGALLTDTQGIDTDRYNLTISSDNSSAINTMLIAGISPQYAEKRIPQDPEFVRPQFGYSTRGNSTSGSCIAGNGETLFTETVTFPFTETGIWKKIDNVWVIVQTLSIPELPLTSGGFGNVGGFFNNSCVMNSDGTVLAISVTQTYKSVDTANGNTVELAARGYGTLLIYTLVNGIYTLNQVIDVGSGISVGNTPWNFNGQSKFGAGASSVVISDDGNTIAWGGNMINESDKTCAGVMVYEKSGSTWVKQATILPDSPGAYPNHLYFGHDMYMSSNGNKLCIFSPNTVDSFLDREIYVFNRSGTTWTKNVNLVLHPTAGPVISEYGKGQYGAMSADGLTLMHHFQSTRVRIWNYDGTNWIFNQEIPRIPRVAKTTETTSAGGITDGLSEEVHSMALNSDASKIVFGLNLLNDVINNDKTYYHEQYYILTKQGSTWVKESNARKGLLAAQLGLDGFSKVIASKELEILGTTFGIKVLSNKSFNSTTNELTITNMSKQDIQLLQDYIEFTPQTNFTDDFNLIYTATRIRDGLVSIRTQPVVAAGVKRAQCNLTATVTLLATKSQYNLTVTSTLTGSLTRAIPPISLVYTLNNPNAFGTSSGDTFGFNVAIQGNYAIVGAPLEDELDNSNSGKAYVFNVDTGALVYTLNNPNAFGTKVNDSFGTSVAIDSNYAIVGTPNEDDTSVVDSGAAYIFNLTNGALVHTLTNPNAVGTKAEDFFGRSVGISNNYAIVGAHGEDTATISNAGVAYIFNVTTGALVHTLTNPSPATFGVFGFNVAINGNYAIVSAYTQGKAYIYNVTTGALVHTLSGNGYFGISIDIEGNYAIIGDDLNNAYIYNVTTGALVHTLTNPNPFGTPDTDDFGLSVSISGNYAIVGAKGEDETSGNNSGKAYVFDVTTGALVYTLNNPNPQGSVTDDNFGYAVSINNNKAIVGVPAEDEFISGVVQLNSGKAYVYQIPT
jgi:hypothetical protein